MKTYAGIGARNTPAEILDVMESIGEQLALADWILSSGAAKGADSAFERGCDRANGAKKIYLPWEGYNNRVSGTNVFIGSTFLTRQHAFKYHPNPGKCSPAAMNLHARNSTILLGSNLDNPVDMVICWTSGGRVQGGTGQALRIAMDHRIPIFNLAIDEDWDLLVQFVEEAQ